MAAVMKNVKDIMDGKLLKGLDVMSVVNVGFTVGMGVNQYKEEREKGAGRVSATAKAVGESVMADMMGPGLYFGAMALQALPKVGVDVVMKGAQMARQMSMMDRNIPFQNATFKDNQQAFTMRQAGMAMARASKYNIQQAMLGNEAQYMHL
jgi:hypothetical protein